MTDLAEIISALVLLEQQNQSWVQRLKGAAGDAAPRPIKETQPATPSLACPPAQAAKVSERSPSRSKKRRKKRSKTAICEKELTALTDPPEIVDVLAYTIKQSAKVVARSETRVKKAIREKELTARKDGRATVIERTELQRWVAGLRTIGRDPVQEPTHVALATIARQPLQKAAHVAARGNVGGRHTQAHARPTPPTGPRSLSNALEEALVDNPRR